ncbi:fanconi-associated nuclease 1-like isoform X2 [Panonychus citri]|nr:fanconi-associated nuclease 1-like isoform X2 [Panonychus citri]XP_053204716.1 fanconi-associated nuclease 1-like isoform X2 [Panonychus citri]XP_053204717.1 fanconi-associated nuclease 1-like isoform X2 [Panonychus citri]
MPPPAPKYDKRSVNSNGDETIGKRKTLLDFFGKGSQQQQQKQIRIDSKTVTRPSIIHQELKLSNNKSVPNVIDLSDEDDLNNLNGNNGYFKSPTVPKSKGVSANRKDNKQKQQQQQSLNQRKNNNIGSSQEIEIIEDEDDLNVISFKTPMLPHRNETKSPMVNSPYPYYQPIKSLWREPVKDDEEIRIEKLKEKNFIKIEDFLQIVIDTKGDVSELNSESKENDPPQVEWQKDYKLKHFRDMIDSVLKDNHYSHLFDDHDWDALYKFTNLSYSAQALYLRLLVRKPNWIRMQSMRYPDIDNIKTKLAELVRYKLLISVDHLNNLTDALNCLDASEIKMFAKHLKGISLKTNSTKAALIDAIKKHVRSSKSISSHFMGPSGSNGNGNIDLPVLNQIKQLLGNTCFRVDRQSARVFLRIALIRFPPTISDDDDGVMLSNELFNLWKVDQGELKYVPYMINKHTKVFPRRNNLILFEEACNLESDLMQAIETRNQQLAIETILPRIQNAFDSLIATDIIYFDSKLPAYLRRFTSGHVLTRALTTCVTVLEQRRCYHEAVILLEKLLAQRLYCLDYRGKWFERLTLNYDKHLKRTVEAIEVIRVALSDNYVRGGHRYSLYLRSKKLGLVANGKVESLEEFQFKLKQTTIKAPALKQCIDGRKNVFISSKDNGEVNIIPVEQVVIEYYNKQGYTRGIHCEGVVYNTLFCLLFWKIIYADDLMASDAFHSPYQRVPLDLNFNDFYSRRQPLINAKLQMIKSSTKESLIEEISATWDSYKDCASLVNWEKCTINLLKEIVLCMKVNTLAAICERLALDYRSHRSGFPDVLLWNPSKSTIKAVEVKGPGDQVSPKQALWINYLEKNGLEAEIVFVKVGRTESE